MRHNPERLFEIGRDKPRLTIGGESGLGRMKGRGQILFHHDPTYAAVGADGEEIARITTSNTEELARFVGEHQDNPDVEQADVLLPNDNPPSGNPS
jgi:hypothetical protein